MAIATASAKRLSLVGPGARPPFRPSFEFSFFINSPPNEITSLSLGKLPSKTQREITLQVASRGNPPPENQCTFLPQAGLTVVQCRYDAIDVTTPAVSFLPSS